MREARSSNPLLKPDLRVSDSDYAIVNSLKLSELMVITSLTCGCRISLAYDVPLLLLRYAEISIQKVLLHFHSAPR